MNTNDNPGSSLSINLYQEIIKVWEWIPHSGPLTKVIPLKLFLDIVPSSSSDITRALRGSFREGSAYLLFRFVSKQTKTSNAVEMSSCSVVWARFYCIKSKKDISVRICLLQRYFLNYFICLFFIYLYIHLFIDFSYVGTCRKRENSGFCKLSGY